MSNTVGEVKIEKIEYVCPVLRTVVVLENPFFYSFEDDSWIELTNCPCGKTHEITN
jgi:hypothetical protein